MNLLQGFFTGATLLGAIADAQLLTVKVYNSSTEVDIRIFPLGSTIVLECTASPLPPQVQYKWTCPHGPCDNEYRKVYNNVIVLVVTNTTTTTSRERYRCNLRYGDGRTSRSGGVTPLGSQTFGKGTLAVYNDRKLLLQNTLITDPRQIPNGLKCVTGRSGSPVNFKLDDNTIMNVTRQGQNKTIQTSQLNTNGRYLCTKGGTQWPFYIYFNNATLPPPQVSLRNTSDEQQLHLQLNTPKGYNSGRFILRYDCQFRGSDPIEVEYKSVSSSSDEIVTRNRSCFVEGKISTVTVRFVDGRNISRASAVVNATSGEVKIIIESLCPPPSLPPNTMVLTTLTTVVPPGTTITIGCVSGYYTDREEILTCGSDGQWKGNITQCKAPCPPPSLPPNTMVLTTLTTTVPPGTTITIGCVGGYYTDREEILTCGRDGQWRGNITQCTGTCTTSNLTAAFHDISYTIPTEIRPGTVVGTHCGEGHQVAISAVCQDDRTWRVQEIVSRVPHHKTLLLQSS